MHKHVILSVILGAALVVSLGAGAYVGVTQHNAAVAAQTHAATLSRQLAAQKAQTARVTADDISCGKRADAWGQATIDEGTAWESALSHMFDAGYNPATDPAFKKIATGIAAGTAATCTTSHIKVHVGN